jgi:hypothetical protein
VYKTEILISRIALIAIGFFPLGEIYEGIQHLIFSFQVVV